MFSQAIREMGRALTSVLQPLGYVLLETLASILNPALAQALRKPKQVQSDEATLDMRLQELATTMGRSSELVAEVEAALEVRQAAVAKLKSEAETAQRIAELSEEHRKAVETLLRGTVAKEGKKTFWLGALVNLVFFLAGVGVTLWIGK